MNKVKMIGSVTLFLALLISCDRANPAKDFGYETSSDGKGIAITSYKGVKPDVVIPAKIEGLPVVTVGGSAFKGKPITSVKIPAGVTSIESSAFSGCTNLTSVKIPAGVTSIANYAFSGCTNLTSVEIPDGVTSIGGAAFGGCTNLTSVKIPASVTSIAGYAFSGCTNLTSVEIPVSVTRIGVFAFKGCTNLTSVKIPAGVTSIEDYAFSECTNLTSVEIPAGVTSIGVFAFKGCTNLTSVEIPAGVTRIGEEAFYDCGLESITIPDSVKEIELYGLGNVPIIRIGGNVKNSRTPHKDTQFKKYYDANGQKAGTYTRNGDQWSAQFE